jgi:hypothetical protein
MCLAKGRKPICCWLLVVLLFGSAWGTLLTRVRPSGKGCTPAARACCCPPGLGTCACGGREGAATQFASLSRCASASDLPAFLPTLPPAAPARAGISAVAPRLVAILPAAAPQLPPSLLSPPTPPPPQA